MASRSGVRQPRDRLVGGRPRDAHQPGRRIDRRGTTWRWPRASQVLIGIGVLVGVFGGAGLQTRSIGWWVLPLWCIPFWADAYVPILLHNRSAGRAAAAAGGSTPIPGRA